MSCKFSVLIPSYKSDYLSEAIQSCLTQTFSDFEIIIVNDHSPENLDSIVLSFHDDRIRYYKNDTNCGALRVVDNWNKCLSYAKGEYVICMGDDDRLVPRSLEYYSELIEKYPGLGVYHARTSLINEEGNLIDVQEERPEYETALSLLWHRWDSRFKQYIGDFCFQKESLQSEGGFFYLPMAWGSDDITAVRAADGLSGGIANTREIAFQYRVNSRTISSTGSIKEKMNALAGEYAWYNVFLQKKETQEESLSYIDKLYLELLNKKISIHFKQKQKQLISLDMRKNMRFFYWIKNHKNYGLSLSQIFDCYINMLRNKKR